MDDFYGSYDQTNSVKALKETSWSCRIRLESHQHHSTIPCYKNTTLGNRLYWIKQAHVPKPVFFRKKIHSIPPLAVPLYSTYSETMTHSSADKINTSLTESDVALVLSDSTPGYVYGNAPLRQTQYKRQYSYRYFIFYLFWRQVT